MPKRNFLFHLCLAVCATVLAVSMVGAAELPEGFRLEPFVDGLTDPWDLADTHDGLILIAERTTGDVRFVRWGELEPNPLCSVAVDSTGEGGLLGIAVHPDYFRNGWIFLYYTDLSSGNNKVTRYTVSRFACDDPVDILPNLGSGASGLRNGGGIDFGPDGKLYVATGDVEVDSNGQSLGTLKAKVLRLNDDGSIPADNPTAGSEIYAVGVRDPKGLTINSSGTVYATDAGEDLSLDHDEVNVVEADGNLGWAIETGSGGSLDPPLQDFLPTVGIHGVADYDGSLFPNADADGVDNDGDSYGPDIWPGVARFDDNNDGVCIGSQNNNGVCTTSLDCLPTRSGETGVSCEKRDDPAEHCPGGTPFGDDDCDSVGKAGIDEPDESYLLDVYSSASTTIQRAALTDTGQLSASQAFFDSTALADCPSDLTGIMSGRDGHMYVLARTGGVGGGALYRIIYDDEAVPREVSPPASYVPLRVGKVEVAIPPKVEVYWEDLRKDAMQIGDEDDEPYSFFGGKKPTAPEREYTVWRGSLGSWGVHSPVVSGIAGTEQNSVTRSQEVPAGPASASYYFLVSGRGYNYEGTLGTGLLGEWAGHAVTDLCDTIGDYDPPIGPNMMKCAPDLTLTNEHGEEKNLADYRGHPIWLDFPAEWCGPCIDEANDMEDIFQDYKDRGAVVISVLNDEESNGTDWDGRPTVAECREWADRPSAPDHTFQCWADPVHCPDSVTGACSSANGPITQEGWPKFNAHSAFPTNVIIDQSWRVVWSDAGWSTEGFVRLILNTLLGGAPTDTCLH